MFGSWKALLFGSGCEFRPYAQIADAGAGGGGTDPAGAGATSTVADGSAGSEPGPEGSGAGDADPEDALEDLLAGEEDDSQARPLEERFKAVTAKLRKLQRRAARSASRDERLKGVDLDDLFTTQRNYRQTMDAIGRLSPQKRALLFGGETDDPTPAAKPARGEDAEFDEKALPFDPNENDVNRLMANTLKENHDLKRAVKDLTAWRDQFQQQTAAQREATVKREWKSAIDAAAATIQDPTTQLLFKDAMAGAYQARSQHGRTAQQIIAHYLQGKVSPPQQQQAVAAAAKATTDVRKTAALQQRQAEANKTLPKTVAPSGTAAPARSEKPSLLDIRKKLGGGSRRS